MNTITGYIDRVISFFGAEASLSKSWANAILALLTAFILWPVSYTHLRAHET